MRAPHGLLGRGTLKAQQRREVLGGAEGVGDDDVALEVQGRSQLAVLDGEQRRAGRRRRAVERGEPRQARSVIGKRAGLARLARPARSSGNARRMVTSVWLAMPCGAVVMAGSCRAALPWSTFSVAVT